MVNGAETELISVRDRGLQYGDGCFETVLINKSEPILLQAHLQRLAHTCSVLRIDYDASVLQQELSVFLSRCPAQGVVKILLTRGVGGRGYGIPAQTNATRILSYSALPASYHEQRKTGITLGVSEYRLSLNTTLAGLKHLNRLDQVLASFSLTEGLDEALCLDSNGHVIEGTKSNVVLVIDNNLVTPSLDLAGVDGLMLAYLRRCFAAERVDIHSRNVALDDVYAASELFMCNSVFGVWPVRKIVENATVHQWSIGPRTLQALRFQDELFEITH